MYTLSNLLSRLSFVGETNVSVAGSLAAFSVPSGRLASWPASQAAYTWPDCGAGRPLTETMIPSLRSTWSRQTSAPAAWVVAVGAAPIVGSLAVSLAGSNVGVG